MRSRTPTRSVRGTRSSGRWARVRSICTSRGIPSAHDRDRATCTVSSWPAVVMSPTLGPVRSMRALVPTVVEYLTASAAVKASAGSQPSRRAASPMAAIIPSDRSA